MCHTWKAKHARKHTHASLPQFAFFTKPIFTFAFRLFNKNYSTLQFDVELMEMCLLCCVRVFYIMIIECITSRHNKQTAFSIHYTKKYGDAKFCCTQHISTSMMRLCISEEESR